MIEKQSLQVDLARKDFYPDFNVQYMWQRTDPTQFPRLLHAERRHQGPDLSRSQTTPRTGPSRIGAASCAKRAPGAIATLAGDLRSQYVIVQQTSEIAQAFSPRRTVSAGAFGISSRYRSLPIEQQDFQALLTAFLDVLHLDEDYWQNMAEYETAVARIEQLTGLSLHNEGAK